MVGTVSGCVVAKLDSIIERADGPPGAYHSDCGKQTNLTALKRKTISGLFSCLFIFNTQIWSAIQIWGEFFFFDWWSFQSHYNRINYYALTKTFLGYLTAPWGYLLWPGAKSRRSDEHQWSSFLVSYKHDFPECLCGYQRKFVLS